MKKSMIAVGGSLVLLLGACSKDASTHDFKTQTEKFLKSSKDVKEQIGQTFTDATCEQPSSKDVGTTYTCTAVAADATTWGFSVSITSKNGFSVDSVVPPTSSATPAAGDTTPLDTTPLDTTADTTAVTTS